MSAEIQTIYRSVGDRLTPISAILVDANDDPVDLTGSTVTCRITKDRTGEVVQASGSCTISDAEDGEVYYAPEAGDVDEAGEFWVWFQRSAGGLVDSFPVGRRLRLVIEALE